MKRIKRNPIMKKVEIIKIPYKPFRKNIIRRYPLLTICKFQRNRDSQGNPLLTLSE